MVIPVYNQDPNYLKLSINSVLQQTYKQFHLVIVIDGENEQTRNIVNQCNMIRELPRITIIEKSVNEGISKALNTGNIQSRKYNKTPKTPYELVYSK